MLKIVKKALHLKRNLGTRTAAGFLRNQGVDVESAVGILATQCYARLVRVNKALARSA